MIINHNIAKINPALSIVRQDQSNKLINLVKRERALGSRPFLKRHLSKQQFRHWSSTYSFRGEMFFLFQSMSLVFSEERRGPSSFLDSAKERLAAAEVAWKKADLAEVNYLKKALSQTAYSKYKKLQERRVVLDSELAKLYSREEKFQNLVMAYHEFGADFLAIAFLQDPHIFADALGRGGRKRSFADGVKLEDVAKKLQLPHLRRFYIPNSFGVNVSEAKHYGGRWAFESHDALRAAKNFLYENYMAGRLPADLTAVVSPVVRALAAEADRNLREEPESWASAGPRFYDARLIDALDRELGANR
jgi:hypothetical protein